MFRKSSNALPIIIGVVVALGLLGAYYLSRKVTPSVNLSKRTNTVEIPLPGTKAILASPQTILTSPDEIHVATLTYNGPTGGAGSASFTDVSVLDKQTNQTVTYHLSGPITKASGLLFWSPVDNKIYFTHATNGIGIYALWSSKIDGTDAKLISGYADGMLPSHAKPDNNAFNMAVWGATAIDFSPDGKLIVTARQDYASNYQSSLWLMSYDGSNSRPIPITENYKNINKIKWNPDGIHIIFTNYWNGTYSTYITDLNGTTPEKVTESNPVPTTTSTLPDTFSWLTYTNTQFGINFKYPSSWYPKDITALTPQGALAVIAFFKNGTTAVISVEGTKGNELLSLFIMNPLKNGQPMTQTKEQFIQATAVLKQNNITIDGLPAGYNPNNYSYRIWYNDKIQLILNPYTKEAGNNLEAIVASMQIKPTQ